MTSTAPRNQDRNAARHAEGNFAIVEAARTVVAQRGLSGMSLRTVAQEAGTSVGSISYRIGDRATLLAALLEREIALMDDVRQEWLERLGGVDPFAAGLLPDLISEWLDQGSSERRVSAVVTSELALMASRDPAALPRIDDLFAAHESLWRALVDSAPEADRRARLIASYCFDEQPFSLLLADNVDYRLLRHSTIRGLLREGREAAPPAWSDWHMALVDRLALPSAAALEGGTVVPEGVKAVIADHIADVLVAQGVGALSHRSVAQEAGIAVSSIAHHYPTLRDIVFAGVEAVYRRMRSEIKSSNAKAPGRAEVVRLTHECAMTALANPAFLPFAIDMRRRRAENVHLHYAEWLDIPAGSDRPRTQAAVMAAIGMGLRHLGTARPPMSPLDMIETLFGPVHLS